MSKNKSKSQGSKSHNSGRVSANKERRIEKGISLTIRETRDGYLTKELSKYDNIRITYD